MENPTPDAPMPAHRLRSRGPQHFIYQLRPANPDMVQRKPTPAEAEAVHYHYEYMNRLSKTGTLVLMGRIDTSDENALGLAILQADSEEAARAIMEADPAIEKGVFQAELFPFRIAVMRGDLALPKG